MRFLALALIVAATASCATPEPLKVRYLGPGPALELARQAAAASIAPAFQFNCDGTARRIEASAGQSYKSITVWAGTNGAGTSATAVFFGSSTSMTTATGLPLCSSPSCASTTASYPVLGLFCITNGTTIAITAQVLQ